MSHWQVFYQFNENYAPYAGASLTSLLENNRAAQRITIYLLLENVSDESRKKLQALVQGYGRELVFAESSALLQKADALGIPQYRGSSAANLRLFFPDTLAPEGRLLYLDSDTIITGSLQPLFEADLGGSWLGMVRDSMTGDYPAALGFEPNEPYCNSGMVLFDLPAWHQNRCGQRIVDHVKQVRAAYPNPDQDLLNMVFRGHIAVLGPEFNFQPCHRAYSDKVFFANRGARRYYTEAELKNARLHPVVLHTYRFLGEFPWHKNNLHPDCAVFDEYLAKSPWKDYQKQPAGGGTIFVVEKWLYRLLPKALFFKILCCQQQRAFCQLEKQLQSGNAAQPANNEKEI